MPWSGRAPRRSWWSALFIRSGFASCARRTPGWALKPRFSIQGSDDVQGLLKGAIESDGGSAIESERESVLEVAQTISVIVSLAERGDDQNVVTLSTLHAAKGLEWPHVLLAGVNEGLLPFVSGGEDDATMTPDALSRMRVAGAGSRCLCYSHRLSREVEQSGSSLGS